MKAGQFSMTDSHVCIDKQFTDPNTGLKLPRTALIAPTSIDETFAKGRPGWRLLQANDYETQHNDGQKRWISSKTQQVELKFLMRMPCKTKLMLKAATLHALFGDPIRERVVHAHDRDRERRQLAEVKRQADEKARIEQIKISAMRRFESQRR